MRLQTKLLKQLAPVFELSKTGLHLDFHQQKIFMAGPGFHGVVDLSTSLDSSSEETVCVSDMAYFLGPVSAYPELEWKNSSFSSGNNRFKIPLKPSDFKAQLETDLLAAMHPDSKWKPIPLTEEIRAALKMAKNFAIPSYGIVFCKAGILGTDTKKAYAYGPLDELELPECSFPLSFIPILNTPKTDFTAYVSWDDAHVNHMILTLSEEGETQPYAAFKFEFSITFQAALGSQTPFSKIYPESVVFDMADVENCLRLAKPIVKAFELVPMDCQFDPESMTMLVELQHSLLGVDYRFQFKVLETTLTTPQVFKMYFSNFEKMLSVWTGGSTKKVKMSFLLKEDGTPGATLRFSGEYGDKSRAILTQLRIEGRNNALQRGSAV